MNKPVVVDTNVLCVANGGSTSSRYCELQCAKALVEIKASGVVAVDASYQIIGEYRRNQPIVGQPGLGIEFLKWLLSSHRYVHVAITPHQSRGFVEFPAHDGLRSFDPSDRKFVAVAAAHGSFPPILQAADSKWWGWSTALQECGINVHFLCPDEIEAKHVEKVGRRRRQSSAGRDRRCL